MDYLTYPQLYQYVAVLRNIQSLSQHESEEEQQPDLNTWLTQRGPFIDDRGPGSLYYRVQKKYKQIIQMREMRELAKKKGGGDTEENSKLSDLDSQISGQNMREGSSEYNGLVRSETLAQMFQKALALRAKLDKIEEESTEVSVEGSVSPVNVENKLYSYKEVKSGRSSKLAENFKTAIPENPKRILPFRYEFDFYHYTSQGSNIAFLLLDQCLTIFTPVGAQGGPCNP